MEQNVQNEKKPQLYGKANCLSKLQAAVQATLGGDVQLRKEGTLPPTSVIKPRCLNKCTALRARYLHA